MLQLIGSSSQETYDEDWRETILILSFSLFFQNNHNFDQSELFVFLKNWSTELKTFSVSSEVLNDWLPVSFGVYNFQQVQADNFFSSNELLNSHRERNNRRRDCFSTEKKTKIFFESQQTAALVLHSKQHANNNNNRSSCVQMFCIFILAKQHFL